jgi:hypothetical protein
VQSLLQLFAEIFIIAMSDFSHLLSQAGGTQILEPSFEIASQKVKFQGSSVKVW